MFGKGAKWKAEYDDTIYKIYDWNGNLAGYFFPEYGDIEPAEKEDEIIEEMNKTRADISGSTLLVPMVKLDLLDVQGGLRVDDVISSLESSKDRAGAWKKWLYDNARQFAIVGAAAHTAREDRNMLSIAIGISATFKLGEKEVRDFLIPLLDKLHADGLL